MNAAGSVSPPRADPGALSRRVVGRIARHIQDTAAPIGERLTELGIADALNVSRTPVRAALEQLAALGIVAPAGPRRGYRVIASPERIGRFVQDNAPVDEDEALYVAIAQDYLHGRLAEQFSEADMLRRYGAARATLQRTLNRMAGDGVVERNPGYGWRFAALLGTRDAREASYRFRLAVEPAAIGQPGYALDPDWARRSRREHEMVLAQGLTALSAVRFFAINADFHELIAAGSGNAFFRQAVRQQNQIRRFHNYGWSFTEERVATNCREHLAILDAIERGERAVAATLMREHLEGASLLEPEEQERDDA